MRTFKFSLFVIVSVVFFSGCSQEQPAAEESDSGADKPEVTLVNIVCPIMGGPADSDVVAEWDGKTVGFCCAGCIPKWEKLSDEEKKTKLATPTAGGHSGSEHEHSPDASS